MIAQTDQEIVENDELIVVENIREMCRCCLSKTSLNDIFDIEFDEVSFPLIFSELLDITITHDDQISHKLCVNCVEEIVRFYEFKKKFKNSQKLLEALQSALEGEEHVTLVDPYTATIYIKEEISDEEEKHKNYLEMRDDSNYQPNTVDNIKEEAGDEDEKNNLNDTKNITNEIEFLMEMTNFGPHKLPKLFQCEGCKLKFDIIGIKRHLCTVCYVCKKDYRELRRVKVHMNSHTNSRPYICEYCPKRFNSSTQLGRHRRIHTGEKPHACKFCDKKFRVSYSCIDHMRRVHMKTEKRIHLCPLCGETFDNSNKYAGHIQSHKSKKNLDDEEEVHVKKTPIRRSPTPVKKYLCEICSKVYKTQQGLDVHLLVHGERKFHCNICDKRFTNKTILNGHLKTHNVEKNCVCQYCGKRFKYEALLREHLRIHTGKNYKYKCEVCAKRLPTNFKLQAHMRSHTGEKPFKCSYCGKGFGHTGNRNVHERGHIIAENPYECDVCQEKFINHKAFSKHRKKHI